MHQGLQGEACETVNPPRVRSVLLLLPIHPSPTKERLSGNTEDASKDECLPSLVVIMRAETTPQRGAPDQPPGPRLGHVPAPSCRFPGLAQVGLPEEVCGSVALAWHEVVLRASGERLQNPPPGVRHRQPHGVGVEEPETPCITLTLSKNHCRKSKANHERSRVGFLGQFNQSGMRELTGLEQLEPLSHWRPADQSESVKETRLLSRKNKRGPQFVPQVTRSPA